MSSTESFIEAHALMSLLKLLLSDDCTCHRENEDQERGQQRGLIYTEHKPLGSLFKMCDPILS